MIKDRPLDPPEDKPEVDEDLEYEIENQREIDERALLNQLMPQKFLDMLEKK